MRGIGQPQPSAARRILGGLCVLAALVSGRAEAQDLIAVRTGRHAGFDRIVLEWSETPWYSATLGKESAVLRFAAPLGSLVGRIGGLQNLTASSAGANSLSLILRPGVSLQHYRLDNRVVIDLRDASRPGRAAPSGIDLSLAAEQPRQAKAERRTRARRLTPSVGVGQSPPLVPPPASAAVAPPASADDARPAEPTPAPAAPLPAVTPAPMPPPTVAAPVGRFVIPVPNYATAAVMQRGTKLIVALDTRDPLDFAAMKLDPSLAQAEIETRPDGAVLMLPNPTQASPRVRREAKAWVIALEASAEPPGPGLEPRADPAAARLLVSLQQPGRVVPVQDPETGLPLLLTTTGKAGQAVTVERRLPELDLLPTGLGVAVLARSDQVAIRVQGEGIAIALAVAERLALDPQVSTAPAAPTMSRSFAFPAQPAPALMERLKALQASIVAAPPLGRAAARRAAAEVMLALGLPQETQALLAIGYTEDPRAGRDPLYRALSSIAALLSGRPGEASGLSLPSLPDTDEIRLWRAVLANELGDPKAAAPGLRAAIPLVLAYPVALQDRLWPLFGQALAEAGDAAGLRALLAANPANSGLALPKAVLEELEGRPEAALAAYAAIAQGADRLARARAMRRAAELKLATGNLTPLATAEALEKSLFAWRGAEELALRLRIAELLAQGGAARRAFALLQESAALFPDEAPQLQAALREAFAGSLETEAPLAAITLYDASPQLLPANARGEAALAALAERLAELDLSDRATGLLRPLLARAQGERRAMLGLRLAALRLGEGDAADAGKILAESAMPDPPAGLALDRALLAARIEARRGRMTEAVASLRSFGAPAAETTAELLTEAQDWAAAAAALALRRGTLPAGAPVSDADQHLLVREAALLALAGDTAGLAALRKALAGRLPPGPLASAFQQLVDAPLQGLADLPRLQRELHIFHRLPTKVEAARQAARAAP
jgi:hypothetical protein